MRDFILGVTALTAFGFLVLWMVSPSPYTPARPIDAEATPPAPISEPAAVAPKTPSMPLALPAPAPASTPAAIPTVSAEPPTAPPVTSAPAPSFTGAPPVPAAEFDAVPAPAFATTTARKNVRRQALTRAPAPRATVKVEKSKPARAPSKPVIAKPVQKPAPARAVSRDKKAAHR